MDIGSIFLILGLFILVALFVARPFIERRAVSVSQEEHELSALLAERDRVVNALQELDFDFSLGKIPDGEYPAQRTALVQRGAITLRQLDTFTTLLAPEPSSVSTQTAEDRLEAAIAERRKSTAQATAPVIAPTPNGSNEDDELEALIATRRRARQEKSAGFCPKCGKPVQVSDKFCPRCGAGLG